MSSIRAFFAIELPNETKQLIQKVLLQLQKAHPHENIRWTRPENLHITLKFIAALKLEDILALSETVKQDLEDFKEFNLELKQLELFPNSHHPRIISLRIEPNAILSELSQRIGKKMLDLGYKIEERPFRGHLTLARITRAIPLTINLPEFKPILVKEISLFRSEPSPQGSVYNALMKFKLWKNY